MDNKWWDCADYCIPEDPDGLPAIHMAGRKASLVRSPGNETRKSRSSSVASLSELSQRMRIYRLNKSYSCFGANWFYRARKPKTWFNPSCLAVSTHLFS